jgi:hypothetical protein
VDVDGISAGGGDIVAFERSKISASTEVSWRARW